MKKKADIREERFRLGDLIRDQSFTSFHGAVGMIVQIKHAKHAKHAVYTILSSCTPAPIFYRNAGEIVKIC